MCLLIIMFRGLVFFFFLFFLALNGGGFFLCVVCMTFTSKVFVVELEVLVCPKDGFSRVDFTEPMILLL